MRVAAGVLIVITAATHLISPLPINVGELAIAIAFIPAAFRGAAALWEWMA